MKSQQSVSVLVAGVLTLWIASTASAGVGLTVKASTLGAGAEVTVGVFDQLNLRAGYNAAQYTFDIDTDEEFDEDDTHIDSIEGEFDWESASLLLDWHPGGHAFRFSIGALWNNNQFTLTADAGDNVEIGDNEYQVSDLYGSISWDEIAPYAGIGVGNAADRDSHWHFYFDLGVMYTDSPEITLSATVSDPTIQALLDQDIERETAELEDDVESFQWYPVLAFGVSYTF